MNKNTCKNNIEDWGQHHNEDKDGLGTDIKGDNFPFPSSKVIYYDCSEACAEELTDEQARKMGIW